MKTSILFSVLITGFMNLNAQENVKDSKTHELVLLAGTIQPFLLQGGNIEVNYLTKKMVFEYSHCLLYTSRCV